MSSLTDTLGRSLRDLRISLTDRCNFRCPYCMPAEIFGEHYEFLPREKILSFEEIERVSRLLVGLGVRKIRLTGGEPLLRQGLDLLIRRLVTITGVDDLALTTNGFLLARYANELYDACDEEPLRLTADTGKLICRSPSEGVDSYGSQKVQ